MTLDDGSKVKLAPESKLTIPKDFGPDMRAVKLEGSAVFDVEPGTRAAVQRARRGHRRRREGDVVHGEQLSGRLGGDGRREQRHGEGRQGKAHARRDARAARSSRNDTNARAATPAERDAADAWRTGTLVVTDKTLSQALSMMKRWYGSMILAPNQSLLERKTSFRAPLDSQRVAIKGIEQSTGLQFGWIGQNMAFYEPDARGEEREEEVAS